jgi:hypothetical protein
MEGLGLVRRETDPGRQPAYNPATRSTAIFLSGNNSGAYYNFIAFAGTAAINLNGSHQYVSGNLLQQNRYEISDVVGVVGSGA